MGANAGFGRRIVQTLGSLKTGITLLIIVGGTAAAGTVILQRPATSPAVMEMRYSPWTLKALDALGLTNVYHAWWFIVLLALVATSIIFASIERWPNAWRFYRRPYRKPDQHFRLAHPTKTLFPIIDSATALAAAERAMRRVGLDPKRVRQDNETSLYVEKNRFAVLAVYVVHTSLLLIFLGGIMDGVWGFKGDIQLTPATPPTNRIELQDKTVKTLPFSIRCDGAGQENYTGVFAGIPKRWWSKLTVLEDRGEVLHKDIEVNDPLVYKGISFYQSGFGRSDNPETYILGYRAIASPGNAHPVEVPEGGEATFDGNRVRVVRFIPDAYRQESGEIFQRSKTLRRPAVQLEITAQDGHKGTTWLLYGEEPSKSEVVPYAFLLENLKLKNATVLLVSHEPGQWAVWAGCLLMAAGLIISFCVLHMRFWAVTVNDGKGGLVLWVGAAANKKNREDFEQKFRDLKQEIANELASAQAHEAPELAVAAAGK